MAHQQSVGRAFVTRYSPEPEVKQLELDLKTEEQKEEDAQLETPSY